MARVTIDETLCTGCGLCAASCPNVFEIGDDNKAHVKDKDAGGCDLNQTASECPVEAINVK